MFGELLQRISRELQRAGIPYMVIGGQAVLVYGEPRLTRDVDVTIGLPPKDASRLLKVLPRLKLRPLVRNPENFLQKTFVLPAGAPSTPLRVDFLFTLTEYERLALQRARAIVVGRRTVRFISPEDLVVFKLLAGRPRDIEDVKGLLHRNPRLDRKYIERWLASFDRELDGCCGEAFAGLLRTLKGDGRRSSRPRGAARRPHPGASGRSRRRER